jgi:hypothetical protein
MAMMRLTAKVMASLVVMRMGMGGRWEAAACSRRLLAVDGRGDKKAANEMVTTRNRVTETPQQHDNQPVCKGREASADDEWLNRGGGDERAG